MKQKKKQKKYKITMTLKGNQKHLRQCWRRIAEALGSFMSQKNLNDFEYSITKPLPANSKKMPQEV